MLNKNTNSYIIRTCNLIQTRTHFSFLRTVFLMYKNLMQKSPFPYQISKKREYLKEQKVYIIGKIFLTYNLIFNLIQLSNKEINHMSLKL